MKHLLFILLVFLSFSLSAQTVTEKDTLANYTFTELHDKSYAVKPDSLKALLYANYHLKKALKKKDTLNIAASHYILSSITKDTLNFTSYWKNLLNNDRVSPKLQMIGNLYLGDFYFHNGHKDKSLPYYLKTNISAIKNKNDSLKSISLIRLGLIKAYNKDFNDAIVLFKSSLNFYKNPINKNEFYECCSILFNLSNSFESLKLYDSAYYYNNKAYLLAIKHKDTIITGYANYNKGTIFYKKEEYISAIPLLKSSISSIKQDENYTILSFSYLKLGKSYSKINDTKNALKYYHKIDSLFLKTNNYYKSQKPAYKFLTSYYKKKNNDKKQLEYINKYIAIDSVVNSRAKRINKTLTENYDIPNLLAEKRLIENRLKGDLSTTKNWVFGISTLAFLLSFFLVHQSRKRKSYKKRFHELMKPVVEKVSTKEQTITKKENTIPKETIESILHLLEQFENNQTYTSSEITLSSLAKTFETNSKYLSQLINQYKGKSFNNYINELRIKYTVEKLKADSTFRKYSIKAIANEVGFNTTESFSKAFYKNTRIRPSFFIKELVKK